MRRAVRTGVVLASVAAAAALAAPSSPVAWTVETIRAVARGDPARGKTLQKDCADCHGPAGVIDTPDVPDLAGQAPLYLYKQLRDYKAGTRQSSIMNDAVASLSDRDMADLAAYYGSLPGAPMPASPAPAGSAAESLASVGDGPRLIVACDACHGERGAGNPGFYGMPSLRGQKYDDLQFELSSFRTGDRGNDVYRVMRDPAKRLSDAEIDALASYYSGAPVKAAPKAGAAK